MRTSELHYELPGELVARYPAERREDARMLVVDAETVSHHLVRDLTDLLPSGALLVVNDTRVVPARLFGRKETGGKVELLLVRQLGSGTLPDGSPAERWSALAKASRRVRAGMRIDVGGRLRVRVESDADDEGMFTLMVGADDEGVAAAVQALGHMPLPPYLERADEPADHERYQTTFARVPGAVAAPTAGLHFSEQLVTDLEACGCRFAAITLHVGPGTFRPVAVDELDDHPMHAETYQLDESTAMAVRQARADGRPVVAVGTTVVRALETSVNAAGELVADAGETRLMIQPGYRFAVVDALLTNFHLPGSTLLALVYAFAGIDRVRSAYGEAIRARYRFYSYGDAMLLRVKR